MADRTRSAVPAAPSWSSISTARDCSAWSSESARAIASSNTAPVWCHHDAASSVAFEDVDGTRRLVERSGADASVWAEVLEWEPPHRLR
jgi:hypothetical protein